MPRGRAEAGGGQGDRKAPTLTLRTETGEIQVHAGPKWFHEKIGLQLAVGDHIEAAGALQQTAAGQVLRAETIAAGDRIFRLRDGDGRKLWQRQRSEIPRSTVSGKVVNLAPEVAADAPSRQATGMFVTIDSGDHELAVQVGPKHFREGNGFAIDVGDSIEVDGWLIPGARVGTRNLMMARTVSKGGRAIAVRDDERLPLWGKR